MIKVKIDGMTVEYDDSNDIKDAAFNALIDYYIKHEVFHGESLYQADDSLLDAPEVLSDIVDNIIKFKTYYE